MSGSLCYLIIVLQGLLCNDVSGRLAKLDSSSCSYKGGQICNGAFTNRIGRTLVKICEDGVLKYKSRYLVGEDFPLVARDTGKGKGNWKYNLSKTFYTNILQIVSFMDQCFVMEI